MIESAAQLAGTPLPAVAPGGQIDTVNSGSFYTIPNRRVTSKTVNGYKGFFKGIWLRAPGAPQAVFASEQTIDALAHAANMDPIAFRIQNIDATQTNGVARWIGALNAVAQAADWKPAVSASKLDGGNIVTGRGVAVGGFAGSYPAIIADITVNKKTGVIKVDHLYAAQDAGTTVNPASVENQMEGCLVQGCSRALLEEVRFTRVAPDEPRLGQLPDPALQGRTERHDRRRAAARPALVGLGRAHHRGRPGRDRERLLRRDRRAPLPHADDTRIRPRRPGSVESSQPTPRAKPRTTGFALGERSPGGQHRGTGD